ncbi:unnamed protein product [Cunninghamella blakesleeana]
MVLHCIFLSSDRCFKVKSTWKKEKILFSFHFHTFFILHILIQVFFKLTIMENSNVNTSSILNDNKQVDLSLIKENSQLQQVLLLALSAINAQNSKNDNDKRTFD